MSPHPANDYDTISYPGHALAQAHPDRLATLATLFGLVPPEVVRCRVLELGCGDGLNLIAIALSLPQAECVGIDLAATGINQGQGIIQQLGLQNITLHRADILDIDPDFGQFDYIIAHGIYSWTPPPVRDKLLAICNANLTENGVAYVSYNTYPGSHLRDMVREMMLYHCGEFTDSQQRVAQARALLEFLATSSRNDGCYRELLQHELERIQGFSDNSLFHDDLAPFNAPVYFHRFMEQAAQHGLQYLAEAHFYEMQSGIFSPETVKVLNQIADSFIAKEQYLDFLKCRRFRQTLLCHAHQQLDYTPHPEKLLPFYIASPVQAATTIGEITDDATVNFIGPLRSSLKTNKPLLKVALLALGEAWPQAVQGNELLALARNRCGHQAADVEQDRQDLGDLLLRAYAGGIVELHLHPPQFTLQPGELPVASPLARLQSRDSDQVTNLRHHTIRIEDSLGRRLLQLLDGSRDRTMLVEELTTQVMAGQALLPEQEEMPQDRQTVRATIAAGLEAHLAGLARLALMMA